MIQKTLLYPLMVLMLLLMLYFGSKAYEEAVLYEEVTTELVSYQGVQEQAMLKLEKWTKGILGDLYDDNRTSTMNKIKEKQIATMHEAKTYTVYFMLALGVIVLGYFVLSLQVYTLFGSLAAMITLVLGLITPILMVTIHKEVDYLGDIVLSFESKGVIGSIMKLWESGDWIVAGVILLFSVITPVLKVSSLLFVSVFMHSKFAHSIVKFFKMIGKWSMVDVFVVATFLVYLTANKGEVSRAEIEVGLYFFLAYVIVSMLVSLSADKMLHKAKCF